jgi:hypothetical protein
MPAAAFPLAVAPAVLEAEAPVAPVVVGLAALEVGAPVVASLADFQADRVGNEVARGLPKQTARPMRSALRAMPLQWWPNPCSHR